MDNYRQILLGKIDNFEASIGVIGLGYVGVPLIISFLEKGYPVIGFDINKDKVSRINAGQSYIRHVNSELIKKHTDAQMLYATEDFDKLKECDCIFICVPTPLGRHNDPDMSYVESAVKNILGNIRPGQLISLESSTYPGTTEELVKIPVESLGYKVGNDIFVVFSPEREDPGNVHFSTSTIPKVVGGITENCLSVGEAIYSKVITKVVPVSSTKAAEMTKLLENIYRSVNIGLVNELKTVAYKMGIDIWEVIEAASTKPFGFTPFYPGPGLGGHCIPIDPFYLTWKAKEFGLYTKFIELAGEINTDMPQWVVRNIIDVLNQHDVIIKNAKCLVLGLAYKKNIDDIRESPAMKIIELLYEKQASVYYNDPYVQFFDHYTPLLKKMNSLEITPENIQQMDCVIIATDHDLYDYQMIKDNARMVIDTRGRFKGINKNVVKL